MQALLHPKLLRQLLFPGFCTQKRLRTCKNFFIQALSHTDPLTHNILRTQMLFCTERLSHRDEFTHQAFTYRRFWAQKVLTHGNFYTETFLRFLFYTAFSHSRCSTQNLAHTHAQNKCANFVMRKLPSCFYAQISKQRCVRKEYQNDHRATRRAIRQAFPVWELLEPTQWHTSIERLARISCVRFGPAASKVTSRLVISPDCVSYRSSYFSLGRRLTFVCGRFLKTVAAALSQAVSLLALGCRCPRWSCK